jgi:hypothetical protein
VALVGSAEMRSAACAEETALASVVDAVSAEVSTVLDAVLIADPSNDVLLLVEDCGDPIADDTTLPSVELVLC